jgi:hypothetical protein
MDGADAVITNGNTQRIAFFHFTAGQQNQAAEARLYGFASGLH